MSAGMACILDGSVEPTFRRVRSTCHRAHPERQPREIGVTAKCHVQTRETNPGHQTRSNVLHSRATQMQENEKNECPQTSCSHL
ncbi:hypothetical protein P5V15_014647 [Pogonomyrmex californicus]